MDYRTIDDMYDRGTLVRLTDLWTPALERYRDRVAAVIDIEVLGYPRTTSRQEIGSTISEKYDCVYTVALMPDEPMSMFVRAQIPVIRVISLDVARSLAAEGDGANFAAWCAKEFCGTAAQSRFLIRPAVRKAASSAARFCRTPFPCTKRATVPTIIAINHWMPSIRCASIWTMSTRRDCVGVDSLDAAGRIFHRRRRPARRRLRYVVSRRGTAALQFSRRPGACGADRRSCAQRGASG